MTHPRIDEARHSVFLARCRATNSRDPSVSIPAAIALRDTAETESVSQIWNDMLHEMAAKYVPKDDAEAQKRAYLEGVWP